jgi:hypothetical protein
VPAFVIEALKNQVEPEMSTWNGERRWEMMMSRFMFINYDTEQAKILQQMQKNVSEQQKWSRRTKLQISN